MARIIILAQPSELFDFVEYTLSHEGHQVRSLQPTQVSVTKLTALLPDLVIVDAASSASPSEKLPMGRRRNHALDRLRILIIGSASGPAQDSISQIKGEAYLERPLDPRSFIARVNTILDSKIGAHANGQIVAANLVIDPLSLRVTRSGRLLSLTVPQFRLLYYMASHPGVTFRGDQLINVGWPNQQVSQRTVDVFMRDLRKKVEEDSRQPQFLFTKPGRGYSFQIPSMPSRASLFDPS
jgi:DNA-binding response OmpR family regulator